MAHYEMKRVYVLQTMRHMPKSGTKSIQVRTTITSNHAYGSVSKMEIRLYRTNQSSRQRY
jgi:hypothetical protein